MQDTQNSLDKRKIRISKVGIKDVRYPIYFQDIENVRDFVFPTVGTFSFFVELQADKKGTHMSRFPSLLYEFAPYFSIKKFHEFTQAMASRLESSVAYLSVEFRYFYQKKAPVTLAEGVTDIMVFYDVQSTENKVLETKLKLQIPVTSLCPCSKAISDYGAHSQRSHLSLILYNSTVSIDECIKIADSCASAAVYPVLKRADEKYVTEKAYNTPRFVEDLVREVATALKERHPQLEFEVEAENFESIHNHNAWALVRSFDNF